jgi:hypothetical protein
LCDILRLSWLCRLSCHAGVVSARAGLIHGFDRSVPAGRPSSSRSSSSSHGNGGGRGGHHRAMAAGARGGGGGGGITQKIGAVRPASASSGLRLPYAWE